MAKGFAVVTIFSRGRPWSSASKYTGGETAGAPEMSKLPMRLAPRKRPRRSSGEARISELEPGYQLSGARLCARSVEGVDKPVASR